MHIVRALSKDKHQHTLIILKEYTVVYSTQKKVTMIIYFHEGNLTYNAKTSEKKIKGLIKNVSEYHA